jgi:hypothetical protein
VAEFVVKASPSASPSARKIKRKQHRKPTWRDAISAKLPSCPHLEKPTLQKAARMGYPDLFSVAHQLKGLATRRLVCPHFRYRVPSCAERDASRVILTANLRKGETDG